MRWLDCAIDSMEEFEQAPGHSVGHGSLLFCSPWIHKELDRTKQLKNNFHIKYTYNKIYTYMHEYLNIPDFTKISIP